MKHKIKYLLLLFSIFPIFSFAQNAVASYAYVQTCYNKHDCYSIGNSALIFIDQRNNELIIQVDFNKFKLGNDSLDEWLVNLSESNLIFRGQLKPPNELLLSMPLLKPITVKGTVSFNGHTKPYNLELILSTNTREGMQTVNNSNNFTDITNGSMQLSLSPKDFKIDSRLHHYKKSIIVAISRGHINNLTPELEPLIKNNATIR
jgi:hypothetical protein